MHTNAVGRVSHALAVSCCPLGPCRALGVLRKPSVGPQLVYRFAPELLSAATQDTVDFLVSAGGWWAGPVCLLTVELKFAARWIHTLVGKFTGTLHLHASSRGLCASIAIAAMGSN